MSTLLQVISIYYRHTLTVRLVHPGLPATLKNTVKCNMFFCFIKGLRPCWNALSTNKKMLRAVSIAADLFKTSSWLVHPLGRDRFDRFHMSNLTICPNCPPAKMCHCVVCWHYNYCSNYCTGKADWMLVFVYCVKPSHIFLVWLFIFMQLLFLFIGEM